MPARNGPWLHHTKAVVETRYNIREKRKILTTHGGGNSHDILLTYGAFETWHHLSGQSWIVDGGWGAPVVIQFIRSSIGRGYTFENFTHSSFNTIPGLFAVCPDRSFQMDFSRDNVKTLSAPYNSDGDNTGLQGVQ